MKIPPTRIPQGAINNQRPSSPDISLISAHLALAVAWSVETKLLSDHLPIAVGFNEDSPCPNRNQTFVNFRRADWDGFQSELEGLVGGLREPKNCSQGEKLLRDAVLTASKHHIPAGRRKDFIPGKNRVTEQLEAQYDDLRSRNPQDPALDDLGREIKRIQNEASRNRWQTFVDSLNRQSNPKHFWKVLKNLSGAKSHLPPNQPIRFKDKFYTKASLISNRFNAQYTNIRTHKSSKSARVINRNLKQVHRLDPNFTPFSYL